MTGFEVDPAGMMRVADLVRDASERTATAGVAVTGLGAGLPAPAAGGSVRAAVDAVSQSWTGVLADLVAGLAQLATWVDDARNALVAVDDEVAGTLRGIPL